MTQARSAKAQLSSKKGAKGYRLALKQAGSNLTVGAVQAMLTRRMKELKKPRRIKRKGRRRRRKR